MDGGVITISEAVVTQILDTIGAIAATLVTAFVGYLVWSAKQRKNKQINEDIKSKILLDKIDNLSSTMSQVVDAQNKFSEGLSIALKSDIIQFRAFRKEGRLNGDSEKQEQEILKYLFRNGIDSILHGTKGEDESHETFEPEKPVSEDSDESGDWLGETPSSKNKNKKIRMKEVTHETV